MYIIARNFNSEKDTKCDEIKTCILPTCIGKKKKYDTVTFESGNEMKLAPVFHKFPEY